MGRRASCICRSPWRETGKGSPCGFSRRIGALAACLIAWGLYLVYSCQTRGGQFASESISLSLTPKFNLLTSNPLLPAGTQDILIDTPSHRVVSQELVL